MSEQNKKTLTKIAEALNSVPKDKQENFMAFVQGAAAFAEVRQQNEKQE